ncbi:hypothetical protein [Mucilaginibacter auburnensis]|uniref:RiboL-PSP-HEPN domain-containing protein n=1 Tax=Mucilaginibacter auburnensis TaxID=1457233 RepID=A0A2H9VRH7_9SPHI|nr:hypothetical protein [Mucilaginibacter auburnensis]PJJ83399.1 hypothetical protein CLV57_0381 [Mucilaginibacter auburnensis]
MKSNYLKKHIEAFFTESTAINANLQIINNFFTERSNQLKNTFPISGYDLYSMMTNYRDLAQLEGGNNLYDTGNSYVLNTDNLEEETSRLLSYVSSLTLSQVLEVFESYLKNILAELAVQNNELLRVLKIDAEEAKFNTIRGSLFKIQDSNNKGFIKILRKISPFFKKHERNNIWGYNISSWFNLMVKLRHIVIHGRQNVSETLKLRLSTGEDGKLFKRHFTIKNNKLIITPYEADNVISHLYEYAHLIYKGLTIDFGLEMDCNFCPVNPDFSSLIKQKKL